MVVVFIWIVVVAFIVGLGVASLFIRRHGEVERPDPSWQRTDEVFNDPSTNRVMRVWLDQGGERHYVIEANQKAI